MNKCSLLNNFENVLDKGYSLKAAYDNSYLSDWKIEHVV